MLFTGIPVDKALKVNIYRHQNDKQWNKLADRTDYYLLEVGLRHIFHLMWRILSIEFWGQQCAHQYFQLWHTMRIVNKVLYTVAHPSQMCSFVMLMKGSQWCINKILKILQSISTPLIEKSNSLTKRKIDEKLRQVIHVLENGGTTVTIYHPHRPVSELQFPPSSCNSYHHLAIPTIILNIRSVVRTLLHWVISIVSMEEDLVTEVNIVNMEEDLVTALDHILVDSWRKKTLKTWGHCNSQTIPDNPL